MFIGDLTIHVDARSGIFCPPGNVVDVAAGLLRRPRNDLRRGINDMERRLLCKVWEKNFIKFVPKFYS